MPFGQYALVPLHDHLQVLNDPEKRRVYDQVGEEGLKGGMPPGGMPAGYGGGGGGGMPAGFNFRQADDIFAEVLLRFTPSRVFFMPLVVQPLTLHAGRM